MPHKFGNKVLLGSWSAAIGIVAMLIVSRIDYRRLAQFSPILMLVSIILLILVRIPGIGSNVNNAWRWFNFGFMSFQPSEMAKLSIILFFSFSLSKKNEMLQYFWKGLVPYLLVIGIIDALLMLQPHYSATILITGVSVIILFGAGAKIWHLILLAIPLIPLGIYFAVSEEYRLKVLTFLDPFEDPPMQDTRLLTHVRNWVWRNICKGIGQSMQKHLYIPEPHTDFIFSIAAEELGL